MAKVTNISGTPRALPLKDGSYIEFAKGETKDFPDADWALLADRDDVKSAFSAEGVADVPVERPKAKKAPAPAKDAE